MTFARASSPSPPLSITEIPSSIIGDPDLERSLLGALLAYPDQFAEVLGVLESGSRPESFTDPPERCFVEPSCQWLFEGMSFLHRSGQSLDAKLLASYLAGIDPDRYKRYGGKDWILGIYNSGYAATNLSGIADQILEFAIARHIDKTLEDLRRLCRDRSLTAEERNTRVSQSLFSLTYSQRGEDLVHIAELGVRAEADYESYLNEGDGKILIPSGFTDLDRHLGGGFELGFTTVIAGMTSMGKTSFALDMVLSQAEKGIPVALFTYEQTKDQLEEQLVSKLANLPVKAFLSNAGRAALSQQQQQALIEARSQLANLPIYIQDAHGLSASHLEAILRRWSLNHAQKGGAFYVDYVQRMASYGGSVNTANEISGAMIRLSNLALELRVNFFCLSQVTGKAIENRNDKRPTKNDIKDSSAIAETAGYLLALHRPAYFDISLEAELKRSNRLAEAEILLLKGRRTGTGIFPVLYQYETSTFHNRAYGQEQGGYDEY